MADSDAFVHVGKAEGEASAHAAGSLAATGDMGAGAILRAMHDDPSHGISVPKPFSEPILLLEGIHVAGTGHVKGIEAIASCLAPNARLRLERDAANRYDSWAVRVLDGEGRRLGWLPVDRNEVIARLMDGGKSVYAKVTCVDRRDEWTRIGIEVFLDD